MSKIDVLTATGSKAGTADLDDAVFGIEPNTSVMHQVVTAQLAARRAGTHSTLTRREVRGGGAKPWKQKGTGRARAGSSTVPQWRGGGVAMGPKPRDYAQKTPKKMKRLALYSALSDRAAEDNVVVVDAWNFEAPRTRDAKAALEAIGLEAEKVLVVVEATDEMAWKSFRNLPLVHVVTPGELNTYDILVADKVVFTQNTLPTAAAAAAAGSGSEAVAEEVDNESEAAEEADDDSAGTEAADSDSEDRETESGASAQADSEDADNEAESA
ncbi:MAG: 50S ribosomal protein L4, partial [Acidimicrobiales bacterium]